MTLLGINKHTINKIKICNWVPRYFRGKFCVILRSLVVFSMLCLISVLSPSPAHAAGRYDPLTDGLVGWWKMDEKLNCYMVKWSYC